MPLSQRATQLSPELYRAIPSPHLSLLLSLDPAHPPLFQAPFSDVREYGSSELSRASAPPSMLSDFSRGKTPICQLILHLGKEEGWGIPEKILLLHCTTNETLKGPP